MPPLTMKSPWNENEQQPEDLAPTAQKKKNNY